MADATGLTVRTLHHYDHLGLVRPSRRTPAGHRLYVDPDVGRLYQVLALRQVGLALDSIAAVLAGTSTVEAVLGDHLAHLDRQLVAIRTLRAQLAATLAAAREAGPVPVDGFLELIRKVTTVDDTVRQYFTDAQLAELAERRERLGEQAIADVQARWPVLIARVQAALDAGTDPASGEAQALAGEWMGLLERFHGGDPALRDSLYRMAAGQAEQIQEHGGPSQEQLDFIHRANAARP